MRQLTYNNTGLRWVTEKYFDKTVSAVIKLLDPKKKKKRYQSLLII